MAGKTAGFRGNDRVLCGIILGVLTFWLFAQTTLNISPDMGHDLGVGASMMNTAVALTALFSGIFIVVIGGLADHMGRVRTVRVGFYLSILGSLLVGLAPANHWASSFLLTGRALQGLSGACIMPASLALVKTYWNGAARQRAISLWSIGSWGGSGVSALFGGLVTESLALLPAPLGPMSVVLSSKLIVVAVPPKHRKFLKVMLSMFMTWPHALLDGKGREQPFAARRNRPLTSRSSLSTSSLRVTHPESAALRRGIALF